MSFLGALHPSYVPPFPPKLLLDKQKAILNWTMYFALNILVPVSALKFTHVVIPCHKFFTLTSGIIISTLLL